MNQKMVSVLFFVLLALGGAFYFAQSGEGGRNKRETFFIFEDVKAENISQLKLDQGDTSIVLELKEGTWTVPDRAYYPASVSKVKSLLYKALGLEVSQLVTEQESNFEKLGVTDEAVKKGQGKVTFRDKEGKDISGILFGDHRKKTHESGLSMPTGQYVRRSDQKRVYMIAEPVTVVTTVSNWLETNLMNILPSRIYSIAQGAQSGEMESINFELTRDPKSKNETTPEFLLKTAVPEGKAIDAGTIGQVRSALENLRIDDVSSLDSEEAKGLIFDEKTIFQLTNGQVITVATAKKDNTVYGKIQVAFDEQLASTLKTDAEKVAQERAEKEKAEKEKKAAEEAAKSQETSEGASKEQENVAKEEAEIVAPVVDLKLSSADESLKESGKHEKWVYKFPEYLGKKFRYKLDDLIQKPAEATQDEDAGAFSDKQAKKKKKKKD